MGIVPEIAAMADEIATWRRHIHANPETAFQEHATADFVAGKLQSFGCDIHRGLARTGVVGTIKAGRANRAIGLRADLDALDLVELNDFSHRSTKPGKMHGCGHDGHTAMLLGAAKYLAKHRDFDGTVHFIFQPAEENEAGGRVMVQDGLFEKFPVESVFGMHNMPGIPLGTFAIRPGPMMASADMFHIVVRGVGAHGAMPHKGIDPVPVAAEIILAAQTIVGRNVDPLQPAVVTFAHIEAGHTTNVIPETCMMEGTVRAFSVAVQDQIENRLRRLAEGIAHAHGCTIEFRYDRRYPPTINHADETEAAIRAAAAVVGTDKVVTDTPPLMGSEDFAWMLLERPGAYIFLGNGDGEGSCMVHNPRYDFNDEAAVYGTSYWVRLVQESLKAA